MSEIGPSGPDPAAEALRLLLAGEMESGLALYRQQLSGNRIPDVPIGMHLLFLERAGRADCARSLLQLALERGANVATRAGGFGASAAEAASEYEALFARGIINSRMILDYLRVLAELGRMDELAMILDRGRLLRQVEIDLPAPGNDGRSLAAAVEALLLEHEAQAVHQEAVQSVRNMRMLKKFTHLDHPAALALTGALERETRRYLEDWAGSDHPFARFVPLDFRIEGWGLISRGPGYNIPHIHQQGWATGSTIQPPSRAKAANSASAGRTMPRGPTRIGHRTASARGGACS